MRSDRHILIGVAGLVALIPGKGLGAVLQVPSAYPTIQGAMDVSASGDTVLVAPGTYSGAETRTINGDTRTAVVFMTDGVVLLSEGGAAATAIDMMGETGFQPEVVVARYLLSTETEIDGFTITGGPTGASGINANWSAKLTVKNCVFRNLDHPGGSGGILANSQTTSLDLDVIDCVFENCTSTAGGAIRHDEGVILISGCEFLYCSQRAVDVTGQLGGIVEQATITGCRFIGNTSTGGGGALHLSNVTGGVVVTNCWFEANVDGGSGGGAIGVGGTTPATIEDNVFVSNATIGGNGQGGALIVSSAATIQGNTFYGNSQIFAAFGGASIAVFGSGCQILNNVIAASQGGEAVYSLSSPIGTGCNIFWQNAAGIGDGYTPGPIDRVVDPAFCDVSSNDFTVAQNSPALPAFSNGCGQIGALGEGCGAVSVEARSWGSIKAEYR